MKTHRTQITITIVLLLAVSLLTAQGEPLPSNGSANGTEITIARNGTQPSAQGAPERFTGPVRIDPLFQPHGSSQVSGAYVTFEPRAHTGWHTHPLGQILIVIAGVGRMQQWGHQVEEIRPGDVVWIPPGVKHWHGADPTTAMTHIAIQEARDGKNVDWLEPVTDAQYGK
jgi:quercetin dioxygenase-like cupin family protein